MLPEIFYFSIAGWIGYFVYLPVAGVVIGLIYLLVRIIRIVAIRMAVMLPVAFAVLTWPLWIPLSLSYQAEKICREIPGLYIYKTVEVDGFRVLGQPNFVIGIEQHDETAQFKRAVL